MNIRIPNKIGAMLDHARADMKSESIKVSKESLILECIKVALNERDTDNGSITVNDPGLNDNTGIETR